MGHVLVCNFLWFRLHNPLLLFERNKLWPTSYESQCCSRWRDRHHFRDSSYRTN
ncbi:hypothetical protein BCIN_07g04010 [Botrytis cinerea B05.10]|uniref:Uncharacterized protein n=1 Tax=Botryotinia fuckeliana (strain B05.10) TaxID=332648 RepID=A0A384JMM3_BOTFB|nr:hypothetical protein BCIN_07g04010 [Botrytis cinerea B05.10]ATZ51836.1 hypothetical protein BCIN_07g04010 [Botrytis cinerea B05.10]